MRKTKRLKINDKEITVKELMIREIIEMADNDQIKSGVNVGLLDIVKSILPNAVDGLTAEDMLDMYPSEIKTVYDAFKEVNEVFFGILASQTLEPVINAFKAELIRAMARDLRTSFAGSSSEGI